MKKYLPLVIAVAFTSCNLNSGKKSFTETEIQEASQKANKFLDRKFDEAVDRAPEFAANLGLKTHYGEWNDRTDAHTLKEVEIMKANLDSLKKNFNLEALDAQTKLSVRLYEEEVKRAEEGLKWRFHSYWLNQMGGEHTEIPAFLINVHKIDTKEDAEAYISRLTKLEQVFEQVLVQLKKREELGVVPPKFTFPYVTADIKGFLSGFDKKDDSNVLLKDFSDKVEKLSIDKTEKAKLKDAAEIVLSTIVKNSYQKLLDYWLTLEKKQTTNNGVWALPDGQNYYNYCLKTTTTTHKTSDEIFELGQKEVARIQNEMRVIMKQVNYKNDSLQDFFQFVRTDKQFKYTNDEAGRNDLLGECNSYIHTFKKSYLDKLFNNEPKATLVVMAVEKFREKSVGGAFYENPALDGSRPGRFYANLYNMDDEPKYQMEALCYHEGIPGHHMQIALAQELQDVPKFRKFGGNTAYIEGWALYSELIPKEVGLYQNPYSDFGRLSMEIFRAARLVVDVGIHSKKWTREQAINYFLQNTANAKGDCEKEIERYFLWPGQATGYKIGMLKILELRGHAKQELGAKFDIKKFHDVVLMNGSVSLTVLEELVNNWIVEMKK